MDHSARYTACCALSEERNVKMSNCDGIGRHVHTVLLMKAKFTARPRCRWAVASKMGGADHSASGQYARAPRIRS